MPVGGALRHGNRGFPPPRDPVSRHAERRPFLDKDHRMKYASLVLLVAAVLIVAQGCANHSVVNGSCANAPETCAPCGGGAPGAGCPGAAASPMPPNGVVAYPYYTLHGPRDFLARNPSPLGP